MHCSTHLNKYHIGSTHSESICAPDLTVILTNTDTGNKAKIIDADGMICSFPGIEPYNAGTADSRQVNVLVLEDTLP